MTALSFDGSALGAYEFGEVIDWCWPCSRATSGQKPVILYALLKLIQPDKTVTKYPVVLKRNCSGRDDQAVIDELKPLFGLQKMGSHRIRLHGIPRKMNETEPWLIQTPQGDVLNAYIFPQWSEYFIFRAATTTDKEGKLQFIPLPNLKETVCFPTSTAEIKPGHREFYYEVQKIFVFRDLIRVSDTNLSNVLLRTLPKGKIVPLSIDEMRIKLPGEPCRQLTQELEKFFFGKTTSRTEALIRMLGLKLETYRDQIETLRNAMSRVITRVDEEKLWIVDSVIAQITDRVSLYYNVVVSTEEQ